MTQGTLMIHSAVFVRILLCGAAAPKKESVSEADCRLSKNLKESARGAHEGRRLWRMQAVVSPMSKGVPLVRFAHIGGPKG